MSGIYICKFAVCARVDEMLERFVCGNFDTDHDKQLNAQAVREIALARFDSAGIQC